MDLALIGKVGEGILDVWNAYANKKKEDTVEAYLKACFNKLIEIEGKIDLTIQMLKDLKIYFDEKLQLAQISTVIGELRAIRTVLPSYAENKAKFQKELLTASKDMRQKIYSLMFYSAGTYQVISIALLYDLLVMELRENVSEQEWTSTIEEYIQFFSKVVDPGTSGSVSFNKNAQINVITLMENKYRPRDFYLGENPYYYFVDQNRNTIGWVMGMNVRFTAGDIRTKDSFFGVLWYSNPKYYGDPKFAKEAHAWWPGNPPTAVGHVVPANQVTFVMPEDITKERETIAVEWAGTLSPYPPIPAPTYPNFSLLVEIVIQEFNNKHLEYVERKAHLDYLAKEEIMVQNLIAILKTLLPVPSQPKPFDVASYFKKQSVNPGFKIDGLRFPMLEA